MKLHVYGDSFVNENLSVDIHKKQYCWTKKVAKNLGVEYKNNAIAGSSAEYSMYKFVYDIEHKNIGSDDYIIYVHTNDNRLYFDHFIHDDPGISCAFPGLSREEINSNPRYSYFKENYDHIAWYYNSVEDRVSRIHHKTLLHGIKNYAFSNPEIKILLFLLEPMPEPYEMDHFGFLKNIPKNLYFPNISLDTLSRKEFVNSWDWNVKKWQRIVGYDPRVNHFSRPNLKILVDLATNTFKNESIEDWSEDKFVKKIFSRTDTLEKYVDYCNQQMLWCFADIVQSYKNLR